MKDEIDQNPPSPDPERTGSLGGDQERTARVPTDPEETVLSDTESTPSVGSNAPPADRSDTAWSIGRYRVLRKLGEGGMGVIYEAEQQSPRRKVAVKVVRGGRFIDDAQVRMFEREADTLARLDHPNIGGIYESGCTEDGQHFFAMELVRGETLDVFLRKRPPATDADELRFRLQVFRKVADAAHYAHQRGVIHRDLKPSNIVVSDGGEIKILDFGLARITDGDLTAATMTTEVGVIKGTLSYMSPEQARGNPQDIDFRADVYALGVILFEMISEQRPYDLHEKPLPEAVRTICEQPPRSLRQTMPGARRLDPDIETIVAKAIEKDADRRYVSAAAFSDDVGRWLTSQPILARPPSTAYQLRKFARRNRALVGGVVATFLVLVAGVIVSTVLGFREAAQRRVAEQARDDLAEVTTFQAGMLSGVDPGRMGAWLGDDLRASVEAEARKRGLGDADVAAILEAHDASMDYVNLTNTAREVIDRNILDRALTTLDERFADQPLIDARLRGTIGSTYRTLGMYRQAEAQLESRLETYRRVLGDKHLDTLEAMHALGLLYWRQRRYDLAESLYLEAVEGYREIKGRDHVATLRPMNNLAGLYNDTGRFDEAEPLYREILALNKQKLGDDHRDTLRSMQNLGVLLVDSERYDDAEEQLLETLAAKRDALRDDDPATLLTMHTLTWLYFLQKRYDEVEPLSREVLAARRRKLGDDHPATLNSVALRGDVYMAQGRYGEAESPLVESLETRRRVLGDDHPIIRSSTLALVQLYEASGQPDKARPHMAALLAMYRAAAEALAAGAEEKNFYAWYALTSEPEDLQDPVAALQFAIEANESTGFENPIYLDTLALAYHRTGRHRQAVDTQVKAISLLSDERKRPGFERMLEEYRVALGEAQR